MQKFLYFAVLVFFVPVIARPADDRGDGDVGPRDAHLGLDQK